MFEHGSTEETGREGAPPATLPGAAACPAAAGAAPDCPATACAATACPDWDSLFRRYGRLVYSVPRRFGLRPEDCEDVYQATWLTAVTRTSPPAECEDGVFVRWLAAIAAWETRNLLRRRRVPLSEPDVLESVPDDTGKIPDRLQQVMEELRILDAALASLPERDRSLLRALFLTEETLSYDEIAQRMGVAIGSVGPLRLRAIERLRAQLEARGYPVPEDR